MRELRQYAGPALKILCLILAVFVVLQLAGIIIRWNPFRGMTVPALPTLTAGTNSPAGGRVTNLMATPTVNGTNSLQHSTGTNSAPSVTMANTNSFAPPLPTVEGTNLIVHSEPVITGTNVNQTNSASATNLTDGGPNVLTVTNAAGTSAVSNSKPEKKISSAASFPETAGINLNQPPGKRIDLPPAVQARISRITESEMLGPVMHPLPMGLLGIAGEFAFLRSASGQTGLVKEGDSLGELKLLKIGINRVLVEQDGQKKELTIFSGYGGESLLPTQKETPDENKNK